MTRIFYLLVAAAVTLTWWGFSGCAPVYVPDDVAGGPSNYTPPTTDPDGNLVQFVNFGPDTLRFVIAGSRFDGTVISNFRDFVAIPPLSMRAFELQETDQAQFGVYP
jgi:hypothetical protein